MNFFIYNFIFNILIYISLNFEINLMNKKYQFFKKIVTTTLIDIYSLHSLHNLGTILYQYSLYI